MSFWWFVVFLGGFLPLKEHAKAATVKESFVTRFADSLAPAGFWMALLCILGVAEQQIRLCYGIKILKFYPPCN